MTELICIDFGHGGYDPGAVNGKIAEKQLTQDIGLAARDYLIANYLCEVKLTRENDIAVSLTERARIANAVKANFFLSIHVNAGGGHGIESYSHSSASEATNKLHKTFHNAFINEIIAVFDMRNRDIDRGSKTANFQVLRETKMPAVLLEVFFLDNINDLVFLQSCSKQLGRCIGQALAVTLHLTPKPLGKKQADEGRKQPSANDGLVNILQNQYLIMDKTLQEMATTLNKLQQLILK